MPEAKHCADCGTEFSSSRKNAKLCRVCRLMSNVLYISDRTNECWACGEKFAPLDRNDKFCGRCNTIRSTHDAKGKCVFCKEPSEQLLHRHARVCRPCGTSPTVRPQLARALKKKQEQLAEASREQS